LQDNSEIIEQLRADLEGLMTELNDLSRRNDELMTAKDSDLTVIRDLDSQLKEYKRKYEQAKTELRSVKGLQRYSSACKSLLSDILLISNIPAFPTGTQDGRPAADGS
jgi:archaellum component FlaC